MVVFINGSSSGRPTITLAKADLPTTSDRIIGIATMNIPTDTLGIITTFGEVRDIDTSGCPAGSQIYLSATTAGIFTSTQPVYPNYVIKVGSCEIEDVSVGKVLVNVSGHIEDILQNAWNGTILESFDARTSSDGATVTMSLERSGGGDLTMNFSDGFTILDCTSPVQTIALTPGATDADPQTNYIYILQSNKVLTKALDKFPEGVEHIKIGFFFVSTATKAAFDDGVLINQNWNDHVAGTDSQGHTTHLGEQNRYNRGYFSGLDANGTDQGGGPDVSYFNFIGAAEAYFKATSGIMYQLHRHAMPAINTQTGDDIHVANWFGDNYHELNNIADIVADSTGGSLANSYFNVFFFDVGNKTGEYTPLIAMVPGGSYSTQGSATNDVDNFNNTTMPREFGLDSSVGVPVCLMTLRWSGGLTTLSHIFTKDFRQGGGTGSFGAGGTTDFADNQFDIFDSDDITRIINFDAGNITAGNTRTITMADANVDLADIATNTTHRGLTNNPHSVTPTQLSLVIGTDVQAWDADLDTLATMQTGAPAALQLLTATELAFLDGPTPGTAAANKASILGISKHSDTVIASTEVIAGDINQEIDQTPATVTQSPSFYWALKGSLIDVFAGASLALEGAGGEVEQYDAGPPQSFDFNNASVLTEDTFNPGTSAVSFSLWINQDGAATDGLIGWGILADFLQIRIQSAGTIRMQTSGTGALTTTAGITVGQLHHIVWTIPAGAFPYDTAKVYIDGVECPWTGVNTFSKDLTNTTGLVLGVQANAQTGNFYDGKMSDVTIIPKELSAAEVLALYNGQRRATNFGGNMNVAGRGVFGEGLRVVGALEVTLDTALSGVLNVTGQTTTGSLDVTGNATISGTSIIFDNLPITDPESEGRLWNNSGVLTVSAG